MCKVSGTEKLVLCVIHLSQKMGTIPIKFPFYEAYNVQFLLMLSQRC